MTTNISGAELPEQYIPVADRILELLQTASSQGKGWYTGTFLATFLRSEFPGITLTDIQIRAIVNHHRRNKVPILSSSFGYKYSTNLEEVAECINDLTGREAGIRAARHGLEAIYNHLKNEQSEEKLNL